MENKIDTNRIVGAIILAGALIALAVLFSGTDVSSEDERKTEQKVEEPVSIDATLIAPVTQDDHVKGSSDPLLTIYEYSDFECPFCKRFHGTLERVINEYGDEVRWVYRHYPITGLHTKALTEAIASECASEMAGPEGFWFFAERFFELSPSNDRTDLDSVFPQIARELGIDEEEFLSCINEERYIEKVESNIREALNTGASGTPWGIIVSYDGSIVVPIKGAFPYEVMSSTIEGILKELE